MINLELSEDFVFAAEERLRAYTLRRSMSKRFEDEVQDECIAHFSNLTDLSADSVLSSESNQDVVTVLNILKEKEKDLELAARIGASLLEQNKELQERNEFLEESLSTSNDNVTQLKHQLRQRSSFFNALANFNEENEENFESERQYHSPSRPSTSQHLHERVKLLEEENDQLKSEAIRLEELSNKAEEREHARVKEYLGQLERANLKISRLQDLISDKNKECENQAGEIERLMREISQRKEHEKQLLESNDDLHIQLNDAVQNHDNLRVDITKLQERYLEVMSMLQETEDELRVYRQRMATVYRTSSVDSLYDSLASELEASDSGCYNTPLFSARCESQQSSGEREHHPMSLQLERLRQQADFSPIVECLPSTSNSEMDDDTDRICHETQSSIEFGDDANRSESFSNALDHAEGESVNSTAEPYDIPSKALVNAFRSCLLEEELKRPVRDRSALVSMSNSADQSVCDFTGAEEFHDLAVNNINNINSANVENVFPNKKFPSLSSIFNGNETEAEDYKDSTPIVETMSFSTISCQSFNTVIPAATSIASLNGTNFAVPALPPAGDGLKSVGDTIPDYIKEENAQHSPRRYSPTSHKDSSPQNEKSFKNSSCSPIHFDSTEPSCQGTKSSSVTKPSTTAKKMAVIATSTDRFVLRPKVMRSVCYPGFLASLTGAPSFLGLNGALAKNIKKALSSGGDTKNALTKSGSSESISSTNSDYDKPKLGEPGRPGTRDLDQSIRRLSVRQKSISDASRKRRPSFSIQNETKISGRVELDYSAFRRRRGLPPSKFGFQNFAPLHGDWIVDTKNLTGSTSLTTNNASEIFGCLSSQLSAMISKCDNCRSSTANTPKLFGSRNVQQLRLSDKIQRSLPVYSPSRAWCSKSRTVHDISSAILGPPSPPGSRNDNTIVRRRAILNDGSGKSEENAIRRRSTSLQKQGSVESSSAENVGERSSSDAQKSLRTASLSPHLTSRSLPSFTSMVNCPPTGLIANIVRDRTSIWNSKVTTTSPEDDGQSTGLNLIGCIGGGDTGKNHLQTAQSSAFGIVRRFSPINATN